MRTSAFTSPPSETPLGRPGLGTIAIHPFGLNTAFNYHPVTQLQPLSFSQRQPYWPLGRRSTKDQHLTFSAHFRLNIKSGARSNSRGTINQLKSRGGISSRECRPTRCLVRVFIALIDDVHTTSIPHQPWLAPDLPVSRPHIAISSKGLWYTQKNAHERSSDYDLRQFFKRLTVFSVVKDMSVTPMLIRRGQGIQLTAIPFLKYGAVRRLDSVQELVLLESSGRCTRRKTLKGLNRSRSVGKSPAAPTPPRVSTIPASVNTDCVPVRAPEGRAR